MESYVPLLVGWIGVFAPAALGAVGSIIGCTRGGQAAVGAALELEGGYGRYIGVSAMPSSQSIYGIVVTYMMNDMGVTYQSGPGLFGVGVLTGIALMTSAMMQGSCCASSINVSKSKPEVFGLSIAPAAIVEGFAVFVLIFALLVIRDVPTGTEEPTPDPTVVEAGEPGDLDPEETPEPPEPIEAPTVD
jgi:V/A-type H+/Na+-transporting ATPase subunit K